ncbi:MAG: protein kinase [Planctomycetes bacterium]|nr:protein kinase [Planctomycetota bacterium]
MSSNPLDPELLFGQLAVEKGLARPEHVQECLDLLREMARNNVSPLPRLADLLREKGYLDLTTYDRTVRVDDRPAPAPERKDADVPAGERFGKYVRTAKLGEGGMGEVWKAWDTELRRWVALKFLKTTDATEVARFRREAQTAAQLTHPGITAIYEAGENFIAMQFVDGKTLSALAPTDPKRIAELARQVAAALQFAHERGIVHRDVKPANVMVDGGGRAYVMDFGLAKSMKVDSSLSVSGAIAGTPAYMSPEQAQGKPLDHRTDVYSLGASIYELLCGRAPFRGDSAYEVLKKVVEEEPYPIEILNPRADVDLRTITMKCLEKDPLRRYGTARELAEDLDRCLRGEAILARPLSSSEKLRRYVRRHRSVLLPSAAAVLLALLFGGWLLGSAVRKARLIRSGLDEAERYEREAVGARPQRREMYLKARAVLNQTLELDPSHPATRTAIARIEGKLGALLQEEDDELKRLADRGERLKRIAKVFSRWGMLHETLDELDSIANDSSLAPDARQRKAAEPWKRVAAFMEATEKDPSSQSAMFALAGRARWILSRGADPDDWMRKSSALDADVPYGEFFSAFVRFAGDLEIPTLPDGPSEPLAPQILDGLKAASAKPLWLDESKEELEMVAESMRALLRGDCAAAEKGASEALSAPELVWLARDLTAIRARARFLQGNTAAAIDDQDGVARMRRWSAPARYWLGRFRMTVPSLRDAALNDLNDSLRLEPRYAPAHYRKGEILEAQEKFREAAASYEEALKIAPEEAEIRKAMERVKGKR